MLRVVRRRAAVAAQGVPCDRETERGSGSEGDGASGAMPNHCLCKLIIGGDSAEDALIFFRSNADPVDDRP